LLEPEIAVILRWRCGVVGLGGEGGCDSGGNAAEKEAAAIRACCFACRHATSCLRCVRGLTRALFWLGFCRGYPLPLPGYFGSKILVMSTLQGIGVGKIFITNGLLLKYLLSMN
jgi:hypothetical protein